MRHRPLQINAHRRLLATRHMSADPCCLQWMNSHRRPCLCVQGRCTACWTFCQKACMRTLRQTLQLWHRWCRKRCPCASAAMQPRARRRHPVNVHVASWGMTQRCALVPAPGHALTSISLRVSRTQERICSGISLHRCSPASGSTPDGEQLLRSERSIRLPAHCLLDSQRSLAS